MVNTSGSEAWNGRFGTDATAAEDDSGVCSPPMWKTSPRAVATKASSPPPPPLGDGGIRHYRRRRRNLSPESRIQAIERGRMELMEMARNMPESSYELSLKDLVEHHPEAAAAEDRRDSGAAAEGIARQRSEKKKARLRRSGSADSGGFLLKMVFPIRFGSQRGRKNRVKKSNSVGSNNSWSKVSPKPAAPEKEWWKKRSKDAREREYTRSKSLNSCSSSVSSGRQGRSSWPRCWAFFRRRATKSKNAAG